ncbi:hypothetical protein AB0B63_06815 [Micromonospora sp. NPDC049081]|uniref:hypothetical protein n=1 Tax=Micromonospora sp. NPDC049081 TaxID=3155150 RepID=UPI0033FCD87D
MTDTQPADDRTTAMLAAPWTAVVNDEIGGWSVTHNGLGPLNGGPMPADMVWSREIAEHIAAAHNWWLAREQEAPSGPLCASTAAERVAVVPESTPNPAQDD